MKLLVFGRTGQVATELCRRAPGAVYLGRQDADLSDPAACAAAIRARNPEAVINAAAYTSVDRAEEEETQATIINGVAPGAMAQACADLDIPFVHISTDYVFDGSGLRGHHPNAPVNPLGAYGRSKNAGEEAIRAAGGRPAILRTSWVFSAQGSNFLKTMLRLSKTRDQLTIVADQIGGPTPASGIAEACLRIADALREDPGRANTYHYAGAPDVSWAAFAREIFAAAQRVVTVVDIPSSDYPTPAPRPLNSRLDCQTLETQFGIERPDWRVAVGEIVKELT